MDRIPPHNLDAEASLIGAAMISARALEDLVTGTTPGDYYSPQHRELAALMVRAHAEGWEPNAVTLWDVIREEHLEGIFGGTPAALAEAMATCPSTTGTPGYARIVRCHARRRALLAIAEDLIGGAYALENPHDAARRARDRLDALERQESPSWAET